MSVISKSINRTLIVSSSARDRVLQAKAAGINLAPSSGIGQLSQFKEQGANAKRYSLFRGWTYSAVHAIALEAAGQPFKLTRLQGSEKKEDAGKVSKTKAYHLNKMTHTPASKAADQEMEVILEHAIIDKMDRPNDIQLKFQFVYSFVANLCLTGWSFIVADELDGEIVYYCLPTTWVKPDHTKGPFAQFRIVNPEDPMASRDAKPIGRESVAFAYFPNPSNPMAGLAPAAAQNAAIAIDDNIQASQKVFFDNGVFPSVILTVGKNPHPNVPAGVRPRLSAAQRRQVYAAVKKVSGGIANYGNPAIVDGLIEKVERLSATQTEMGWEKSEKSVRARILSAFGVHPFILGEEMAGSYAQAYIVQDRFGKRVNAFLDLLSCLMTEFVPNHYATDDNLLLWWEKIEAVDPSLHQKLWQDARKNGDVSQNEFRSFMGLPPDEDLNQALIDRQSAAQVIAIAQAVAAGTMQPEQGVAVLEGLGLPADLATRIAGQPMPQPEPAPVPTVNPQEMADEVTRLFHLSG